MVAAPAGRRYSVAVIGDGPEDPSKSSGWLAAVLVATGCVAENRLVAGIGDAAPLTEAHRSHRQALLAARATALAGGWGPVGLWEEIGVYGQLLQLAEDYSSDIAVPSAVRRLFAEDPTGAPTQTARTFLDSAGNTAVTAARLRIHRSTLYYRLNKIERITGLSLEDGVNRLTLHLGLKVAEFCAHGLRTS